MWRQQKGVNMNDLQIFNSDEFGEVRTVLVENEPMFCLTDICKALQLTQPSKVKERLNEKGVRSIPTLTNGGEQKLLYINESNLYKTIFQSRKESAERFTEWVTSEVLPTIRKTGSYNKPMSTAEKIKLLAQGNEELNERVEKVEDKLDSLENDMPLYGCEIEELKNHISRRAISILDGKNSEAYKDASIRGTVYKDIYRQLKREYGYASSYKSLKRKYLADAHEFVDCYAAPTYLQEQITDANAQQSFA